MTDLSKEHNSFCQTLTAHFTSKSQLNTQELVPPIQQHFSKVGIYTYIGNFLSDILCHLKNCQYNIFYFLYCTNIDSGAHMHPL